jgi:RNA polymerase sigma-70 factor (ECF subfamily)
MSTSQEATALSELVRRCQSGDELAWESLVRRHQARVLAVAFHYVRSHEEARDVAQEVFVRIYRSLPRFQTTEAFLPWMIRVARSCSIDHLRRRKARPPAQDIAAEEAFDLRDDAALPDELSERASDRRLLDRALGRLSELHREILVLKEIQGLTLLEVARTLEIPVGTAKSRSNRARAELAREFLAIQGEEGRA